MWTLHGQSRNFDEGIAKCSTGKQITNAGESCNYEENIASCSTEKLEETKAEESCNFDEGIAIERLEKELTSCTTVYFLSMTSNIPLHIPLSFSNLHDVSLIGLNKTTIHCDGKGSLDFKNVTDLKVKNLTFSNCAKNFTMVVNYRGIKTYTLVSGLRLLNCTDVLFRNVKVKDSIGIGISVLSTRGNVTFRNCTFSHNGNENERGGSGLFIELSNYNNTFQDIANSSYSIDNCTFEGNIAYEIDMKSTPFGRGGAVRIYIRDVSVNNKITVNECNFYNNTASRWGGAFFASIHDTSANNCIHLNNTNFTKNSSPEGYGGAYYVGYICENMEKHCINNKYLLTSCEFLDNNALYGGGLTLTSTRMLDHAGLDAPNEIKHKNCKWANNSAHYGSALAILPDTWSLLSMGSFPFLLFEDCSLIENHIMKTEVSGMKLQSPYQQTGLGVGAIYCTLYDLHFSGKLVIEGNNGSAILGSSCSLSFSYRSSVYFYQNSGYMGGALYLLGYSTIYIQDNSVFRFINNTADTDGGAIYYKSSDIVEHAYSYNCFIALAGNATNRNISFYFSGNLAGTGNSAMGQGNSIYITSLLPCMREYNSSAKNNSFLDKIANFTFHNNQNEISTDVRTFKTKNNTLPEKIIPIIPGKYTKLNFEGLDDLFKIRNAVFLLTVANDGNSSIKPHYLYITKRTIRLFGSPGDEGTAMLSTMTDQKVVLSFRITIQPCPPGYTLYYIDNEKYGHCKCSSDTDTPYIGIESCEESTFQALRKRGFWFGYKKNKPLSDSNFLSGYCPKGFCTYSNNIYLPQTASREELNAAVCRSNRIGALCSQCKDNTSVYYHSPIFKCGHQDLCHLGWLFYIASDIVPVTILFLIIITFNIPLTSGSMNSFVFYAQSIRFFQVTAHDRIMIANPIKTFLKNNQMVYEMFNLQFFAREDFSFCLIKNANTLDLIVFQFTTILYSFFLVLLIIFLLQICNTRRIKLFFRCRVHTFRDSVVHGLSAFLVLCFAQCAKESMKLVTYGFIQGKKGKIIKTVVYDYGDLEFFSPAHLKYVIPALSVVIIIVVIPLAILLGYPLYNKCLAALKIEDAKCVLLLSKLVPVEKLKPFLDSFQGDFKDKYRFFSGLYFMYRILILINMSMNYIDYFFIVLEVQLILTLLVHGIVQPYRKQKNNTIDLLLFANMALINGISMHNFTNAHSPHGVDRHMLTDVLSIVQQILILIPLLGVVIYCGCRAMRFVAKKCSWWRSEETTPNDLLAYCELPSSRTEHEEEIAIVQSTPSVTYDTFEH